MRIVPTVHVGSLCVPVLFAMSAHALSWKPVVDDGSSHVA